MDTIFITSGSVALSNLIVFTIHGKTKKPHTMTIDSKYWLQHGVMNLNYQMDHTQYQIFKILNIFLKNIMKMLIIIS